MILWSNAKDEASLKFFLSFKCNPQWSGSKCVQTNAHMYFCWGVLEYLRSGSWTSKVKMSQLQLPTSKLEALKMSEDDEPIAEFNNVCVLDTSQPHKEQVHMIT